MKYLRKFENVWLDFNVGDYVVLIEESKYSRDLGFKLGDIFIISEVDDNDNLYTYKLNTLDSIFSLWVEIYQIRKASEEEISANKYNL